MATEDVLEDEVLIISLVKDVIEVDEVVLLVVVLKTSLNNFILKILLK